MSENLFPDITVGIVHSRDGMTSDGETTWLQKAINSVSKQLCPSNIDLIVIDNMDRKKSIGRCYNEIVESAKNNWIFFLGDDDYIQPDYLTALLSWLVELQQGGADPPESYIHVTGFCTAFSTEIEEGKVHKVPLQRLPQGMWSRDYVLKNRFNEDLKRYVDVELFDRANEDPNANLVSVDWNYGYYYRQHDGELANVSGNKIREYIAAGGEVQK